MGLREVLQLLSVNQLKKKIQITESLLGETVISNTQFCKMSNRRRFCTQAKTQVSVDVGKILSIAIYKHIPSDMFSFVLTPTYKKNNEYIFFAKFGYT